MAIDLCVNSYCTVEDAGTYFGERLGTSGWDNAGAPEKEKALIMAFRAMEKIHCWQGVPTVISQTANWPRAYVPKPGSVVNAEVVINVNYGATVPVYLDSATIPDFIVQAQCEEALAILNHEGYGTSATPTTNPRALLQEQGVRSVSIDGVSESYTGNGVKTYGGAMISSTAWGMLRPYLVLYGQLTGDPPKLEA